MPPGRGEDQVGLLLDRRQLGQPGQHLVVLDDPGRTTREARRSRAASRPKSRYCSTVLAVRVHALTGGQPAGIATYVVSRYSSIPSKPPSRPNPLAFTPPNGAAGLETRPVLMPTMPKSSDSASRMVRSRSLV